MNNELRIEIIRDSHGNDVSLDNIPIEAAESLKIFIESLTNLAKTFEDSTNVRLKLENNSIDTCLVYEDTEQQIITSEIHDIVDNNSTNNEKIEIFKTIQDQIQLNGLEYKVYLKRNEEERELTDKFKGRKFAIRRRTFDRQFSIKFLEGSLYAAGGRSTVNVHIENIQEEKVYKVSCTKQQAKKLNQRLYSKVYLSVIEIRKTVNEYEYFYIDDYLREEQYLLYKELHSTLLANDSIEKYDLIYRHINDIVLDDGRSNEELIKIIRLYSNKFIDKGILRTILMTVKPLVNRDEGLIDHYNRLAEALRSRSKTGKI